ncbi:MAG: recombinase family protein [Candidatus Heimdallarchaeaceae archaeon]
MQLMYLGIPEADNKVRSKKVRTGMRQGLKEGRWNCSQPKGYIPGKDELGKVLMQPDPVKAPLIKQLFEDFATGAFAQSEILKMPKYKLLGLSTSHLSRMLQFELYAGWVRVPAYKDEPEELIRGLHDPIIDEETFEKVQTQLGLRRKLKQKHSKLSEYLPLRGFLQCNTCGGNLTGSASTSKTGKKHYYYHCNAKYGCKERIKVSDAHNAFDLLLQSITPKEEVCDLFKVILEDKYKSSTESKHSQIELIKTDIKKTEARKQVLTNKLVDDIIDNETYTSSRKVYDAKIIQLNGQLLDLGSEDDDVREFVDFGTRLLTNIHYFYSKSTVQLKQKLLSSILEGKLIFTGEKYRTPFFKEAISFITGNIKALEKIKSKKGNALSNVSLQVVLTTQFSNSFYSNLRELKELQQCYIDEGLASKDGAFLIPKGKPEQLVLPNRI